MFVLIWPLLLITGFLLEIFRQGWRGVGTQVLILGTIGGIFATYHYSRTASQSRSKLSKWVMGSCTIALVSIICLRLGLLAEGYGLALWFLPVAIFSLLGLVLAIIDLVKK